MRYTYSVTMNGVLILTRCVSPHKLLIQYITASTHLIHILIYNYIFFQQGPLTLGIIHKILHLHQKFDLLSAVHTIVNI